MKKKDNMDWIEPIVVGVVALLGTIIAALIFN